MTHAALQDLVKKWRERAEVLLSEIRAADECDPDRYRIQAERNTLLACSADVKAALSAMEGEAVAWQVRYRMVAAPGGWGQWHEWSLPDRPFRVNGWEAEYRALYTAPPPQQADQSHVLDVTESTDRINVTPSPGPQGGPIPEAVKRGEKWVVDVGPLTMDFRSSEGATAWNTLRRMISDNVFATPPAHQPGEVATPPQPEAQVSDAMVPELEAEWTDDCGGKKDYDAGLVSLSTRYWPRGGGFLVFSEGKFQDNDARPEIKPSAKATILLQDAELVFAEFEADTEAEVKAQVEAWAKMQFAKVYRAVKAALTTTGSDGNGQR